MSKPDISVKQHSSSPVNLPLSSVHMSITSVAECALLLVSQNEVLGWHSVHGHFRKVKCRERNAIKVQYGAISMKSSERTAQFSVVINVDSV